MPSSARKKTESASPEKHDAAPDTKTGSMINDPLDGDELQFAIKSAGLAVWDYDPATNKFSGNSMLREWFGLDPADRIDLDKALAVIIEGDRERVVAAIQKSLQYDSGGSYDIEYCVINPKTNIRRYVCAKGRAWFNEAKIAYRFNGILQDVTGQRETQIALEKQARLYDTITANTPDLIYVFDLNYRFLYANNALLQMWGKSWDESIGQGLRALGYEEWHATMHEREIDQIVADQQPVRGNVSFPHATLGKRVYDYILVPVFAADGTVEAVAGTTRDITDLKIAEEAIRKSEECYRALTETLEQQVAERTKDLQQSNDDLMQFAHVASHDLKEPVRKIQTFAKMIDADRKVLSELGRTSLEKVSSAADRMAEMISGVLNYSVVSGVKHSLDSIDLNQIIADVAQDLEVPIAQKNARIHYSSLPQLEGARVLLHQLFYNLIYNSLKFAKEDVPPEITILTETEGDIARIEVADNGIGFEQEYAEKIFKAFSRLHSKDRYEGTGLGLSLCKRIVERHGGSIRAEGSPQGARFVITLPVKQL